MTATLTQRGVAPRDDDGRTVTSLGFWLNTSLTINGDNDTIVSPLFTITGTVQILGIWGVVTTALGSNHTAAYWRLNDQTAQVDITLSTGTTLSSAAAGSVLVKKGLAGAALTLINNSAGRVSEPTTLETQYFSPFVATKKTGALTQIEYVYTTNQSPTTGAIQFFVSWIPVSADGQITVA